MVSEQRQHKIVRQKVYKFVFDAPKDSGCILTTSRLHPGTISRLSTATFLFHLSNRGRCYGRLPHDVPLSVLFTLQALSRARTIVWFGRLYQSCLRDFT